MAGAFSKYFTNDQQPKEPEGFRRCGDPSTGGVSLWDFVSLEMIFPDVLSEAEASTSGSGRYTNI